MLKGKVVRGTVVYNNDPLHFGRIKVKIDNLYPTDISNENIPWSMPLNFKGGVNSQGNVNIPDIGSSALVVFLSDDMYSSIYLSSLPNIKDEELLEDYPNTYGQLDRSGNLFLINTEKDIVKFYHVSGTNFTIDGKGRTKVQITNFSEGRSELNPIGLDVEIIGDLNLKVRNNINIQCENLNLDVKNNTYVSSNNMETNTQNLTKMYSNGSFIATSESAMLLNAKSVIEAIGSTGNFGGRGSSFDGYKISSFTTDVLKTPFTAFSSEGTPPSPNTVHAASPVIEDIPTPKSRERQAYQGE